MKKQSVEDKLWGSMHEVSEEEFEAELERELEKITPEYALIANQLAEYPADRCVWLCPPHLEQCGKERGHRGDCVCSPPDHSDHTKCMFARALQLAQMEVSM